MVTLAPSKLAEVYQTYPTARAAAVAALRGIDNTQYERGGGVLYSESQNLYAATEPAGQDDDAHFAVGVRIPQGWSLHSIYHTHPSGYRSTQFSSDDVAAAQQLKAPSYLLSIDDNKIRVFDPASSKVSKDSVVGRFAYGDMVEGRSRAAGRRLRAAGRRSLANLGATSCGPLAAGCGPLAAGCGPLAAGC